MLKLLTGLVVFILILNGCDKGIAPQLETQTGFSGKLTFIGQWPDSVKRTHLVVFKDPLLTAGDFSAFNLRFVSTEIPFGSSELTYSSLDSSVIPGTGEFMPGQYAYVAVAQSFTQQVSLNRQDWVVVGLFYNEGDNTKPGTLNISENIFIKNINIICDFDNPPPQPPGGN